MKTSIKDSTKRFVERFGYQLRKITPVYLPFTAQQLLTSNPSPVIMDVGACVGQMSAIYRRHFPRGRIYAFEPAPDTFALLAAAVKADKNIHPIQLALSDRHGESPFNVNGSLATNSLLSTDKTAAPIWGNGVHGASAFVTREQVMVKTDTLDSFCSGRGIETVDILKIDAQGSEVSILRGAEEMFAKRAIKLVYLEILVAPTYTSQPSVVDYFEFFERHGYIFYNIFDIAHRGEGRLVQFDAIFVAPPG